MELDENQECDSMNLSESENKHPSVGIIKQEAVEADDVLLQYKKPENVSTDYQLGSTSLNTFDADVMSNRSLEIKLEPVAQVSDEELSVKEELLHEEIDIKSEDETTQETHVDEKHNLGNKLRKHRKHGEKTFLCNICDHSFRWQAHLNAHLRSHTGEKPFKCNICECSFGHKGNLKNHLRTHTEEKPFNCTICHYSCARNSALKSHLRTHTGEKPFLCNICDRSFGRQGHLNRHLRTHTGEKPFKCNICDYSCQDKSTLRRHLRSHTGEKPYKCSVCNYRFAYRSRLVSHLRRSHMSQKS